MAAFLIYQVKVAVLLALLYLFYKAVFRHWTLHRLGRGYLLGSVLVSLLLPFCSVTFHHTVPLSEVTQVSDLVPTTTAAVPLLEEIAGAPVQRWILPAFLLYASGVLIMLIRLVRATGQAVRLIRCGELIRTEDRIKIIVIDADTVSCSWMNHVLLSREDSDAGRQEILAHERAHIALHHSLDLLLVDLFAALQWFNPFVRSLREELLAVHEYQADEAVLRQGADTKAYQLLILSKEASARGFQIANSFSASLLKSRIRMMDCARTSCRQAWKMLYIIPLLGVALLANAHVTSQVSEVPLLLFDRESITLEALVARQGDASEAAFLSSNEMARIFGGPVPGGIISFNTVETADHAEGGVRGRFQLVPGFNVDDPDAYPLLIVNGVDFPYWRRKEFLSDRWQWKWFAFLHAEDAVPIYGKKARNGAFIVNVELSIQ